MKNLYFILLLIAPLAQFQAQTIYVDQSVASSGDGSSWSQAFQTIQEAVDAASANNEIRIAEGIYQPVAEIDIEFPLTIKGAYPAGGGDQDFENNITQIQADADPDNLIVRIFDIGVDASTYIEGVRLYNIRNGIASDSNLVVSNVNFDLVQNSAIFLDGTIEVFMMQNCVISNSSSTSISASSVDVGISFSIQDCIFQNGASTAATIPEEVQNFTMTNVLVTGYTAGSRFSIRAQNSLIDHFVAENNTNIDAIISHRDGVLTIKNSRFENNSGEGNLCLYSSDGVLNLENTKFNNNTAISSFPKPTLNIRDTELTAVNCEFNNNYAEGSQPDIIDIRADDTGATSSFINCEFKNNTSIGSISTMISASYGTNLVVDQSIFEANVAGSNSGIDAFSGSGATITNNTFVNHTSTSVLVDIDPSSMGSSAVFLNNRFSNNATGILNFNRLNNLTCENNVYEDEARLDISNTTTATMTNEYFRGNPTGVRFITIDEVDLTMNNTLMISERPTGTHRLINSEDLVSLHIVNSTFTASNITDTHVAVHFVEDLPSTFRNSIVWSGDDLSQSGFQGNRSNLSTRYSLVKGQNPSGAGNLNGTSAANAPVYINPANDDFRMLRCSPTINAGLNSYIDLTTDLKLNPRIFQSTVDMGAYELQKNANANCDTPTIPNCAVLTSPANGSVDVPTNTAISWSPRLFAVGYLVSVGTTDGGTDIVDSQNVTTYTTLNLVEDLPADTQIFVTVVSYNGEGDQSPCESQSFITRAEDDNGSTLDIRAQNISVGLNATGNATIQVSDIDNGSSSTVGGLSLSLDQTTFTCDDIGFNPVTLTASDASGDTASRIAVVTVVDILAPTITCPGDGLVTETLPYTLPNYFETNQVSAIDNCTPTFTSVAQNPTPGTLLDAGEYTITTTITDDFGNESECSFLLTVQDALSIPQNDITLQSIVVYPNPIENHLMLENPSDIVINALRIYDISGRVMMNTRGAVNKIDVSQLQSGNYIVMIETEYGQVTRRIVKK